MDEEKEIKRKGKVIEALPSLKFRVKFDEDTVMFCYMAGRLHKNFIRILIGDTVEVVIPEEGHIGRITRRL
jgi:translation initiation factor IF-1